MKQKFLKIVKDRYCRITSYKTYRSDMGCQVYKISVTNNNIGIDILDFEDGYFVGSGQSSKDSILSTFTKELETKLK